MTTLAAAASLLQFATLKWAKPIIQHLHHLSHICLIWDASLRVQQSNQQLQSMFGSSICHDIASVEWGVTIKPCGAYHLDLVTEVCVVSLVQRVCSFSWNDSDIDAVE